MTVNTHKIIEEIAAERAKQLHAVTTDSLIALAQWHEDQARYPVDVAGSDRNRYHRAKFHAEAALDIRAAVTRIERYGVLVGRFGLEVDPRFQALIHEACLQAGVMIVKTKNIPANAGIRPSLALAIALAHTPSDRGPAKK